MDYPYADFIYITVLLPEEKYITQTGNESAMYAAIDAKKGEDKQKKGTGTFGRYGNDEKADIENVGG